MKTTFLLCAILSFNVNAVITKNCPDSIEVMMASPELDSWTANKAYQDFFKTETLIGGELTLQSTANSECEYTRGENNSYINRVTLTGSLRPNATHPATAIIRYKIPVSKKIDKPIGNGILYVRLLDIQRSGITAQERGSLYYQGKHCSWGDCIPDHRYMGKMNEVIIQ